MTITDMNLNKEQLKSGVDIVEMRRIGLSLTYF